MTEKQQHISPFGLGSVGLVTAACLARRGHTVVGVDVKPAKVGMLESGRTPVVEVENLKNEFEASAWHGDGARDEVRNFQGTARFYE